MRSRARVCLIMCFRNEAEHLPAVLASLAAQTVEHRRLFLIAVDDGSTDGGEKVIENWLARGDIAGRLIRAEFASIPYALNRGLTAVGIDDYVVRLDAHTIYEPRYVELMLEAFASMGSEVWCVGTSDTPLPSKNFGKALHASLFTNPMGLGPADFRSRGSVRTVKSVYLGAWRPGVLQRLGGYDVRWPANEDAELAERVRSAGGRVVRIEAGAEKIMTRGPLSALRQWTRYGFWRAQTLKHHPGALGIRHLAPPIAFLAALLMLASPARAWLVPAYLAYALAIIGFRARGEAWYVTLATLLYFPLFHCGYALGILSGLAVNRIPREEPERDGARAAIERVRA
jgi:succinoglycan biosynthesis protein ExoA